MMEERSRGMSGGWGVFGGKVLALFLGCLSLASSQAASANTTWFFEGIVREQNNSTAFPTLLRDVGIDAGVPISGYVELNPYLRDLNEDPVFAQYGGAIVDLRLSVGDVEIEREGGTNAVFIAVDAEFEGQTFRRLEGTTAVSGGALDVSFAWFELVDLAPYTILDDSIPMVPPDLSSLEPFGAGFFSTDLSFSVLGPVRRVVRAEITHLAVPEPGSGLLVGLGLAGMAGWRRARQRGRGRALATDCQGASR